jgi:hypothetical protein
MTRPFLLALIPLALTVSLLAQPAQETSASSSMESLAAVIQTELGNHGDRILGNGVYGWSTRLNKIDDCRAELSVQTTNNRGEASVRTETVRFSLGAIEPFSVELRKERLELPCARKETCISSTSTCSVRSSSGIVIDCATPSQKRVQSFVLEFDGDASAATQLERAFRQAVAICHVPQQVSF